MKIIKRYFPLFMLLSFSGNPILTDTLYSKELIITYTILLFILLICLQKFNFPIKPYIGFFKITLIVFVIIFFQYIVFNYVSILGVLGYLIKIFLGFLVLSYYKFINVSFEKTYIKIITFLSIVSLPFFILNFYNHIGYQLPKVTQKSLIFYTSHNHFLRNSGMFWEPGAFAGYLLIGLLFILILSDLKLKNYNWSVFIIITTLITTLSTTGYLILGVLTIFYIVKKYTYGKFILLPVLLLIFIISFNNISFLSEKIEEQYVESVELDEFDVSNTRFGSLLMDMQYIESSPLLGNGLHYTTRYRFHPWITEDIGHGNGMSNFIVYWGIPFFLFWVFCVYKYLKGFYYNKHTPIFLTICMLLILQGEQFLNYPLFLMFFTINSFNEK